MTKTTYTDNELFEMAAELVAGAVSQQPGVLSIRCSDAKINIFDEVLYKEMLVTVNDELFDQYLEQCQNRSGKWSMDSNDIDAAWDTWTPWSTESLARFVVQIPAASYDHDDVDRFEEFAGELLANHAVLKQYFNLYEFRRETNNIVFTLAPEHLDVFVDRMRAIHITYPVDAIPFMKVTDEKDDRAFTDEQITSLGDQNGRLFNPTTKKFANPTD